jgi:hypothetical protein
MRRQLRKLQERCEPSALGIRNTGTVAQIRACLCVSARPAVGKATAHTFAGGDPPDYLCRIRETRAGAITERRTAE